MQEIDKLIQNVLSSDESTADSGKKAPEKEKTKILREKVLTPFQKIEKALSELYDIRYNEISNEIEFKDKEAIAYKPLNENNVYRTLEHSGYSITIAKLTAILRSDFVPVFNPFTNYFENLTTWNEGYDPDYISKLADYVKAKHHERFKLQFKKMLVRSIACALNDGMFNKQAFILVHEKQNSGKSTFCRWLCPPVLKNYYAENISIDKDSLISLTENFFINLDELATLSKLELNTLKSMFSKDFVKIRKPYDRRASTTSRRANFIGSTNKTEFLNDETGSVRWLCFEIDGIDWNYQKDISIDSVWCQAYALYKAGFKYQLTQEEISENETVNKEFQIITPEIELIQKTFLPASKVKPKLENAISRLKRGKSGDYVDFTMDNRIMQKFINVKSML